MKDISGKKDRQRGENMMHDRISDSGGFTLLELMISITLLIIIVAIIGSAMRLGYGSVEAGEKKIKSLERFRTAWFIINAQIESEVPLKFEGDVTKRSSFMGDKTSCQFATHYSIWSGYRGYVLVSYRIDHDDTGKKALFASESVIGMNPTREIKLLDALDDISFGYLHKDIDGEDKLADAWSDEMQAPDKIKINFSSGMKEYSFVIPMRTSALQLQTGLKPAGSSL
jgi:general secretion pathway protein J